MFGGEKRRVSASAGVVGLLSLVAALGLMIAEAVAHHPGSHASRLRDGQVRLEVAATVTDGCTRIGTVRRGVPGAARAPAGVDPVVVQLERPAGALCTQALGTARADAVLDTPPKLTALHLFVVAADGRVTATERVPVR